ncbi:nucleotidyltransferase domain-containing protein [Candidatus Woesearchaeota archaeon]|nr:nucleotidyltransferase domain-containing protein [Candidatus Woesearchaeota archaeon]
MGSKLLPYALDFISFLLQKIKKKEDIKNVILFGSVARDEDDKQSDVDIFIDVTRENTALEKECASLLTSFYSSAKYKQYWKLFGITNEIILHIGVLDTWKELKPSIIADGIVLYGKFMPKTKDGTHVVFFIWENITPNSTRVLFNKQLFGYTQHEKHYSGLLEKYNGERMGKGCIIVPLEHSVVIHTHFKKYKIAVKIKKVLEY